MAWGQAARGQAAWGQAARVKTAWGKAARGKAARGQAARGQAVRGQVAGDQVAEEGEATSAAAEEHLVSLAACREEGQKRGVLWEVPMAGDVCAHALIASRNKRSMIMWQGHSHVYHINTHGRVCVCMIVYHHVSCSQDADDADTDGENCMRVFNEANYRPGSVWL